MNLRGIVLPILSVSFSVLVATTSAASSTGKSDVFPLGEVPAGWTYRSIPDFERKLESLPFTVKGYLERTLSENRTVTVYLTMLPLSRGPSRLPASQWKYVESTFVPKGIETPKTYVLNEQNKVGPQQLWSYRESKITRTGVGMNVAAFKAQNKFSTIFLVLRQDDPDYANNLGQLKELVSSLKWTP